MRTIICCLLIVVTFSGFVCAYGAWQPVVSEPVMELEILIEELAEAIRRAEEGKSAHPSFLDHLQEIRRGFEKTLEKLRLNRDLPPQWGQYSVADEMEKITSLRRVLGQIQPLEPDGWETDRATPALAVWEEKEFTTVAIEGTVTFLRGSKELTMGLYTREGYAVAMAGTGVNRSRAFVGVGDARTPGKLWSDKVGKDGELKTNNPYRFRVEIRLRPDTTRIDFFLDGEKLLSQIGETSLTQGYVAIRTWGSEVRFEDLRVEELLW
jgi:hypothetical protein